MPQELTGGQRPKGEISDKVFILIHGYSGVGKTAFSFSFAPDFWLVNCDRAIGQLSEQLPEDFNIVYEPILQDMDTVTPAIAKTFLAKFDVMLNKAQSGARQAVLNDKRPGTFILDGADNFWEYVKIALVPEYLSGNNLPKEYAPANTYMDNVLQRLGQSPLNVVFTVFSTKVWAGAKTDTDRVKATGFKHMERFLTHEAYFFSPEDRTQPNEIPAGGNPGVVGETGQSHRALITRSKLNESLINRLIPNLTFSLLFRMTFGRAYPDADKLWSPSKAALALKSGTKESTESEQKT